MRLQGLYLALGRRWVIMSAKILVVDDSALMAKMAQDQLAAEGYQVETAPNGPSALTIAESWEPDLVLLDVMMPEMDGFEACRRLRKMKATSSVPIIMLTSISNIEAKKTGFAAGANDYITKPFEPAELLLRVAAQLKRAQMLPAEVARPTGKVIALFSLRGGAGCTSLAVNVAIGIGRLWGTPVPLLDLALPIGVCDSMLNQRPQYRLDDLVTRPVEELDGEVIDGFLTSETRHVRLLAGFDDPVMAEKLTENLTSFIIEHLRQRYAHLVLDLAHDFSQPTIAALDLADVIVVPITPDLSSARLTQAALKVFEALGYQDDPFLIHNRTFPDQGIDRTQLDKFFKRPIQLLIPYIEGVWGEAINKGIPVINGDSDSPLVRTLEDLSWHLSDSKLRHEQPAEPTPTWQRVAKRMVEKAGR